MRGAIHPCCESPAAGAAQTRQPERSAPQPVVSNKKTDAQPAMATKSRPALQTVWMQVGLMVAAIAVVWGSISIHLLQRRDELANYAARDSSNLAYAAEQS